MKRKDFELIASALLKAKPNGIHASEVFQHRADCFYIADVLSGTDPRFDEARFLKACGIEREVYEHRI